MKVVIRHLSIICLLLGWVMSPDKSTEAGQFEFGISVSYYQSNVADTSQTWSRRWSANISYTLFSATALEFEFQDVFNQTIVPGFQDTTVQDRILSLNWVQGLVPPDFRVQPYIKIGVGQLNRDLLATYTTMVAKAQIDSITAVLTAGLKFFISRRISITAEATSYLSNGIIDTWKDNLGANVGVSVIW